MIVVVKMITEYVSIILCMHKVAKKQIKLNWCSLFDFVCYTIILCIGEKFNFGELLLYMYLFVYIKVRVVNTWKHAIKTYVVTICTIPILQLLIYALVSGAVADTVSIYLVLIFVNILIILLFLVCKEKYLPLLIKLVTKFWKAIFLILITLLIKYLTSYYLKYKMLNAYYIDQIVIYFLIVALMLILWINAENEKRHKAEELRIYQLYTQTFEDAVRTIRTKQHEFDNHINAIKCMQYTIHDMKNLIDEQNKYCNKILKDNKYNKLLKIKTSPILIGYLYSKFTTASAYGIDVEYEIEDIDIVTISINDLIEIIGILFDNAVEALEDQTDKEIEVILRQTNNELVISIANRSEKKTNGEIEKFFEYGYSTKGNEHGVGLYRVNVLLKKYKAYIQVENVDKYDKNYLQFKVMFDVKIKGIA